MTNANKTYIKFTHILPNISWCRLECQMQSSNASDKINFNYWIKSLPIITNATVMDYN